MYDSVIYYKLVRNVRCINLVTFFCVRRFYSFETDLFCQI